MAYRALAVFDYTSVDPCMYVEGHTEETLGQKPTIWAEPGIVTCKLKFKWTGSFYKQFVITVDLVPAIPVREWPQIARKVGSLLLKGRNYISGVPCGFKVWPLEAFILSGRDLDNGPPITRAEVGTHWSKYHVEPDCVLQNYSM